MRRSSVALYTGMLVVMAVLAGAAAGDLQHTRYRSDVPRLPAALRSQHPEGRGAAGIP